MPNATQTQQVVTTTSYVLSLTEREARLLRTMLGGLKLKTRRGAVVKNGGTQEDAEQAAVLTKEVFTVLENAGASKLGSEPVPAYEEDDSGYDSDSDDSLDNDF